MQAIVIRQQRYTAATLHHPRPCGGGPGGRPDHGVASTVTWSKQGPTDQDSSIDPSATLHAEAARGPPATEDINTKIFAWRMPVNPVLAHRGRVTASYRRSGATFSRTSIRGNRQAVKPSPSWANREAERSTSRARVVTGLASAASEGHASTFDGAKLPPALAQGAHQGRSLRKTQMIYQMPDTLPSIPRQRVSRDHRASGLTFYFGLTGQGARGAGPRAAQHGRA